MREAYAWLQNCLVGRFFEGLDGATRFEYAPEASMPISLSLPLDCSWQADAPGAFLDGLLPDNDSEREAMRLWFGAASADPLDLLVATDATGGLCFTSVPEPGRLRLRLVSSQGKRTSQSRFIGSGAAGRRGSPMTAAAVSPLRVRRANSPWSGSTTAGPGRTPSTLRPTL